MSAAFDPSADPAADPRMLERQQAWDRKPVLREIYRHLFRRLHAACIPGPTLEIGGGTGMLKSFVPDAVTTDIIPAPWLDMVADAQFLPVADGAFANIVMFDVMHHIEVPRRFLHEAARVLRPGGRLVMIEPAITPASWPFYHFLHEEAVDMGADPLHEGRPSRGRDPFAANQAIPTLLATKHRARLAADFPQFRIVQRAWLSLFAYPLSGGFKPWSAIPLRLVKPVLWVEDRVAPLIGRLFGFRLLLALEKKS
jgi:SAM-dependent methyltransferase